MARFRQTLVQDDKVLIDREMAIDEYGAAHELIALSEILAIEHRPATLFYEQSECLNSGLNYRVAIAIRFTADLCWLDGPDSRNLVPLKPVHHLWCSSENELHIGPACVTDATSFMEWQARVTLRLHDDYLVRLSCYGALLASRLYLCKFEDHFVLIDARNVLELETLPDVSPEARYVAAEFKAGVLE